jgi:hypothetical protein
MKEFIAAVTVFVCLMLMHAFEPSKGINPIQATSEAVLQSDTVKTIGIYLTKLAAASSLPDAPIVDCAH